MKKKLLSTIMAATMLTAVFTGCGSSSGSAPADVTTADAAEAETTEAAAEAVDPASQEEYDAVLVYVVAQDSQDQDKINEKINELAKKDLNMNITLMPMTFSTWMTQLPMMLAGGEQVDLFPMFSSNAPVYVASDYLVDLRDYLTEENASYLLKEPGMDAIECCTVGDFIYGVPTMKERCMPNGFVFRTDCLEAAGIDPSTIKSYDDVTEVFEKVQALYPDMIMFGGGSKATPGGQDVSFDGLGTVTGAGVLENYGQTTTLTNYYKSDRFKELCNLAHDWYEAGYVSKDMPTTTDSGETLMKAGNLFSYMTNCKPNTKQEKDSQTGYDTTIVPMNDNMLTTGGVNAISYGVGAGSKDPARAVQLLNWISSHEEVNDLLNWGIEGIHWQLKEDGTIDFPEGVTAESVGYHQNMGYIMPNQFNSHVWAGNDPDIFDQYDKVTENAIVSKAYGFNPDLSEVSDQIAALSDVTDRYLPQLTTGSVDVESTLAEFIQAMEDAGIQDVIDCKQTQLDEWLAQQ